MLFVFDKNYYNNSYLCDIKNFKNLSNQDASNIASIKELCRIRDNNNNLYFVLETWDITVHFITYILYS